MQPPPADGEGILKKRAVDSIWIVAGISFLVTYSLSMGHCHHQSSSVWSDLCHSRQPAVPQSSGQQGPWPLKLPQRRSISTDWDKHQDKGREGRGRWERSSASTLNFYSSPSTFPLTPALEYTQHTAESHLVTKTKAMITLWRGQ